MRILYLTSDLDVTNGWGRYSAGFLAEARERNGTGNVVVNDPGKLRSKATRRDLPYRALRDALRLRKDAAGVDVIHAATEPVAPAALLLSLMTGVPYVVSAHGTYGDLRTYRPAIRWLYRLAFRRAVRILAVSRYTADVMRRQFPRARIEVVPGGFAFDGEPPKRTGIGSERRILAVGAMKPRKGFHTLAEALGLLKAKGFAFRTDIIGPKDSSGYVERVETRVRELGLEDRVSIKGRVAESELRAAYERSDLFVLPSEHEGAAFEGLGLVYLEAMSRGLPAIGCLESGAEDVIRDGVNGLLVPPGQPERLAAAIERVLGDDALWKRMSEAAPHSIESFRWEKVGAKMDAMYHEAADTYAR